MKPKPTSNPTEVESCGQRIAEIQTRKQVINTKMSTLRSDLAALELEASDLAKEHLIILRRFDSVAVLP